MTQIRIAADGQTLFDETIRYGQSVELDLDVSNVLRLEVFVTRTDQSTSDPAEVVLANAVVAGGADSLSKIEVSS